MPLLKVQKLKRSELNAIINLHYQVLDESFLNNFGLNFLKISYQTIVKDKNNIVVITKQKDQLIGFLVATKDGDKFNSKVIKKNFVSLAIEILKSSILKPTILIKLIQWQLKPASPKKIKPELQFIAIDPKYQGKGIGTKMIKMLNQEFRKSGIEYYRVGTKAQNKLSNKFYKKLGFKSFYKDEFFGDKFNYYLSPNTIN